MEWVNLELQAKPILCDFKYLIASKSYLERLDKEFFGVTKVQV